MSDKLKEYLSSGNYLPLFLRDFHDQKTMFKRLDRVVKNRGDSDPSKEINWVAGQIYVIDIFLWFMAKHGYTLQKSRKKVEFFDIDDEINAFEKEQRALKGQAIGELFALQAKNRKEKEENN